MLIRRHVNSDIFLGSSNNTELGRGARKQIIPRGAEYLVTSLRMTVINSTSRVRKYSEVDYAKFSLD